MPPSFALMRNQSGDRRNGIYMRKHSNFCWHQLLNLKIIQILFLATEQDKNECIAAMLVFLTVAGIIALLFQYFHVLIIIITCAILILISAFCLNECDKYKKKRRAARAATRSAQNLLQNARMEPANQAHLESHDPMITTNLTTIDETLETLPSLEEPLNGNQISGSALTFTVTDDLSTEDSPPSYEECPPYEEIQGR